MSAEDPRTLEPILPAVCEKKVFCLFCFSANKKPHFLKRLHELPQLQVVINDYHSTLVLATPISGPALMWHPHILSLDIELPTRNQ